MCLDGLVCTFVLMLVTEKSVIYNEAFEENKYNKGYILGLEMKTCCVFIFKICVQHLISFGNFKELLMPSSNFGS